MAIPVAQKLTPEQYLERERNAEIRSEYWHGEVYAMSGGTERHDIVCVNLTIALRQRVQGRRCRIHSSNMKVGIAKRRGFSYPDLTLVCGEPRFLDETKDVLTNPSVIFEVLSPSTRGFDSGQKFAEYQKLDSLKHYVLLEQDICHVQHYERTSSDEWRYRVHHKLDDVLVFSDLSLSIPLSEIYEDVELAPAETE
ncbi:MAG: Uma2 family endonuclease [Bryobacterales bacterium]|nr:Uma2 family endonuclease [Bryobacterales bacterium]